MARLFPSALLVALAACANDPGATAVDADTAPDRQIASIRGFVPGGVEGQDVVVHVTYFADAGEDVLDLLDPRVGLDEEDLRRERQQQPEHQTEADRTRDSGRQAHRHGPSDPHGHQPVWVEKR